MYDYEKLLHETDEVGGDIVNTYATTTDQEFGDLITEDGKQLTNQFDALANTNALLDNTCNADSSPVSATGLGAGIK